ncbi:MAG: hypothetical protein ABIH42_02195 [Planctomycetota bacterium]
MKNIFSLLLAALFVFAFNSGCVVPRVPQDKNTSIEKSAPAKPKRQVEIEKELRQEFNAPPKPIPER